MKRILLSLMIIALASSTAIGATRAYFSDTETSTGNTFTAGSLDLTVDSNNGANTVKFAVTGMRPGNQPTGQYKLKNIGTVNGFIDLSNISVTNSENGILEPEAEAGDTTTDVGELQDVVGLTLYWDNDCDRYFSTGDVYIYNGMTGGIASSYNTDKPLAANATQCVQAVLNWWNTTNDNKAMGDGMVLNMTYNLGQNI